MVSSNSSYISSMTSLQSRISCFFGMKQDFMKENVLKTSSLGFMEAHFLSNRVLILSVTLLYSRATTVTPDVVLAFDSSTFLSGVGGGGKNEGLICPQTPDFSDRPKELPVTNFSDSMSDNMEISGVQEEISPDSARRSGYPCRTIANVGRIFNFEVIDNRQSFNLYTNND